MYRLKRLYLHNVMSIDKIDLDFSKRGLAVIRGFNNKGGDSNGSGKTAIIAGLMWTCFGRTQNGARTKDIIRRGQDSISGIVEFEQAGKTYRIMRTADTLDFLIDGEKVQGLRKDIQEVINQALQTNYDLFMTFNVFTRDWQRFITEVGDAEKKKLFKSILNLKKLDNALDKAKVMTSTLKSTAVLTEGKIKQLEEAIPQLEKSYIDVQRSAEDEQERRKASIDKLLEEKERRATALDDTEGYQDEITKLDEHIAAIKAQHLDEKLEYLNIQLSNIDRTIFHNTKTLEDFTERLEKFLTITAECPMCGQKIIPKNRVTHRRHLELYIKEIEEVNVDLSQQKETLVTEIHTVNSSLQTLADSENRKTQLQYLIKKQDDLREQYTAYCTIIDNAILELNKTSPNLQQIIQRAELLLAQAKDQWAVHKDQLVKLQGEIDIYSYITWLYSRQGVISAIISKCFDRLKYLANKYLIHVCTEGFKIDISPFRILKSGDLQDEIDIHITDGKDRIAYNSLSAGQQQRINTALLIAMFMWGREIGANSFDLMILDEVLDLSLGIKGQEDTIRFITSIKPLIHHIILISHKPIEYDNIDMDFNMVRGLDGISRLGG